MASPIHRRTRVNGECQETDLIVATWRIKELRLHPAQELTRPDFTEKPGHDDT